MRNPGDPHLEMPSAAFGLSNEQIGLLLGRMWDGDGHVNPSDRNTYYATSSKRLAQQVQHLLLRLGILGRIREVSFAYAGGPRVGYQVFVTGVENLRPLTRWIGVHLVAPAKLEAIRAMPLEALNGPSKDLVPVGPVRALARAAKSRTGETWGEIESGADVSARDLYPVGTNPAKIGFTRGVVNRLAQYFGDTELQRLGSNDVLWDRVVSIEPAGEQQTYDLEIADTHNFVANDIIVHNSHSVAYSVVAYHTAFLKTHHPCGVHGGAAVVEHREDGRSHQVHRRSPRNGARGAGARCERIGVALHGDCGQAHSLRAWRHPQRGTRCH
ncbi:LAGLIDADG family homing endonuclease [Gemmatimonas sp.]|uniref:LAGLIDADG family homing endonuclease n=1 Tax=Gemmatimonas sp. TaxID=1962908 RepID=UPI003DA2C046